MSLEAFLITRFRSSFNHKGSTCWAFKSQSKKKIGVRLHVFIPSESSTSVPGALVALLPLKPAQLSLVGLGEDAWERTDQEGSRLLKSPKDIEVLGEMEHIRTFSSTTNYLRLWEGFLDCISNGCNSTALTEFLFRELVLGHFCLELHPYSPMGVTYR